MLKIIKLVLKKNGKSKKHYCGLCYKSIRSYPGTTGYMVMPQSFFRQCRSVWHIPQNSTFIVTSSGPFSLIEYILHRIRQRINKVCQITSMQQAHIATPYIGTSPSFEDVRRNLPRRVLPGPSSHYLSMIRRSLHEKNDYFFFLSLSQPLQQLRL